MYFFIFALTFKEYFINFPKKIIMVVAPSSRYNLLLRGIGRKKTSLLYVQVFLWVVFSLTSEFCFAPARIFFFRSRPNKIFCPDNRDEEQKDYRFSIASSYPGGFPPDPPEKIYVVLNTVKPFGLYVQYSLFVGCVEFSLALEYFFAPALFSVPPKLFSLPRHFSLPPK